MSRGPFALTHPCALCPFRSNVRPYLTRGRVASIERDLVRAPFHCHSTVAKLGGKGPAAHCAGALILFERIKRPSQAMRMGERLGLYDRARLDMSAPVFKSFEAMKGAQDS